MRLLRGIVVCALAWLALPCPQAAAQEQSPRAYQGTVSFDNARQAYMTSAIIYGAANQVDRMLRDRPNLAGPVVSYDVNLIVDALTVPGRCDLQNLCPADRHSLQSVDIMSGALSLGYCHGDKPDGFTGCFYGSTGFAGAVAAPNTGARIAIDGILLPMAPIVGGAYALGVVDKGDKESGARYVGGIDPSYIVGYDANIPSFGSVRLGYLDNLDQRGMYTNLTVSRIKGFLTAAVTDEFQHLPFLATGLRDLLPGDDETVEKLGATTLQARRLDFSPPALVSSEQTRGVLNMWTGHLRQVSIMKMFDVAAAAGWQPTSFLHEVTAGIHTRNFAVPKRGNGKPVWDNDGTFAAALHGGMVELPRLPYYGVKGGRSWHLSAAVEVREKSRSGTDYRLRIGLRRNDPEILALFPYAQNAVNFYMQVMGSME